MVGILFGPVLGMLLLLLFTTPVWALGGPPLMTDDPGTPGSNNWEINVAVTTEISRAETRFETPIMDLNYGLGERVQLKYEVPFVISQRENAASVSAIDRSMGGVKYRFVDREKTGIAISTYPQVAFKTPVKSALQDESDSPGTEFILPVELEQAYGNWEFNEELGYHLMETETNQVIYGGALTYSVRDGVALLTEFHGTIRRDLSDDELIVNVGGQFALLKSVSLLVSAGRSFRDYEQGTTRVVTYVGMQFRM